LIITANTGGADLVVEGETGFLVPIRRPDVIAEKINWFVENRTQIPAMGENARRHAKKYTWENYSKTIVNSIIQLIGK
jgi:glycosyltransferase involved in cell wall biosynthesis